MTKAVPARLALTLLFAALAVSGSAAPARAHALLTGSEPASGARLESAPGAVRLTLTEQPDPAASSIKVLNAAGASVERGPAKADGLTYTVALKDLPDGVYTVTWRVLSRVDGHVTGGAFAFGVRADPGSVTLTQADVGPKPSAAGVAGRALLYVGGFLIIGAAVAGWAFGTAPAHARPLARAGWFASVTGVLLIAVGQAGDAGIGLGAVLSSSIGTSLLWRLGPLILGGVALLVLRGGSVVPAGAAAAAFGAHVFYGHAGAGSDRLIKIGAQWLHLTAAAVWIGGLVVLLAGLKLADPDTRGRAAKRYSSLALGMFVLVGALGSVRALDEVGSWGALTSTTFGKIVLFKVAMLGVLLILGAVNRLKTVARAADDPRPLLRVGRIEVVVAMLILVATGVLASVAPAKDAVAGRPEVLAEGTDFGETVRAALRVTPGGAGPNEFEVTLSEPGSGDPVRADEVRLRFLYAGVPSVEPTELTLRRAGDGVYRANGSNLAVPGPWIVVVGTRIGVDTAEVRLTIGTRTVQQVTPIEQQGAPTIYDIALGDGRVQMYVQPGTPGQNEVHATFFDADGSEDPRATDAVLVGTPPSGEPVRLQARVLSPGHFVADAQLRPGRWRFDVFAQVDGGGSQTAWFEHEVET